MFLSDYLIPYFLELSINFSNGRSHLEFDASGTEKPTLDELYRRLRDLDRSQVDERMIIMLNSILQLESQGEGRESAMQAVLIVRHTTYGMSNQEQTTWL